MADEVVATFSGPLNSYSINLSITNAANTDVRTFGISGRTAKFPITFDSMGSFSGRANLVSTAGIDTEVVLARFSNFGPGEMVTFSGVDPDFTGDSSSGVRVLDMSGSRAMVSFADGTTGFGEFEPTEDGTLRAVITRP